MNGGRTHYIKPMMGEFIFFGAIAVVLAVLAVAAVLTPIWRGRADAGAQAESTDIDIYRDQLAEVDRDLARGVLDAGEAERTRTEISRRLLLADTQARTSGTDAPRKASRIVAALTGVAVLGGAIGLYSSIGAPGYGDVPRAMRLAVGEERRANRPTQAEAEALIPIEDSLSQFDQDTQDLIATRRATVFEQPQNIAAWRVLAQTEAAIGQYHRATRAQERVLALKGAEATTEDAVELLDLLVVSTQGYVSPEAEIVALSILQEDATNIPALYYAGLMYAQNDRPDRAFDLWRRVVETGPQGTLHWNLAAGQIQDVAAQLGVDYALPATRGPSAEDIAAAQNMAPEDRRAMIQGMVGALADRLASEGGPPQDWARLITALGVMGDLEAAGRVAAEAETIFGADVRAVTLIRRAASEAGIGE